MGEARLALFRLYLFLGRGRLRVGLRKDGTNCRGVVAEGVEDLRELLEDGTEEMNAVSVDLDDEGEGDHGEDGVVVELGEGVEIPEEVGFLGDLLVMLEVVDQLSLVEGIPQTLPPDPMGSRLPLEVEHRVERGDLDPPLPLLHGLSDYA